MLSVTIEGKDASKAADELVIASRNTAIKRTSPKGPTDHRAIDWMAVVDFVRDVSVVVSAQLIVNFFKERREKKKANLEITLTIKSESIEKEFSLPENISDEEAAELIAEIDQELSPPK